MPRRTAPGFAPAGAGAFALGLLVASASPAASKTALDYRAYDAWCSITGTTVSDDGRYVAYALVPEDGDPTLVVRDTLAGSDVREPRGIEPHFTADSKYVVYTVRAPNDALRKARREHKKPDELPPNGLGILDLASGAATTVERVKSVAVARDAGRDTIAYLRTAASPSPSPTPASERPSPVPATSPGASRSPGASPSASASPDALHTKSDGNDLVIRDVARGAQTTLPHVDTYAVSHDGRFVAYATQSKSGADDGLWLAGTEPGLAPRRIASGAGHYAATTFAHRDDHLAFASDAASFADAAPRFVYYALDAAAPEPSPSAVAAADDAGLPAGWAPSVAATPAFSHDARYLYVGTAPAPTPVPSGTPEPMAVDIWTWNDDTLQSKQRKDAEKERKRTYTAAIDLAAHGLAQLATPEMRDVVTTLEPGAAFALGSDDRPYRRAASWQDERADVYAVALGDASRRRLARAVIDRPELAPTGRFVVAYDRARRAWFAASSSDGRRVDLTSRLGVPFFDERDDHPDLPPPYAFAGWLDGDRAVLLNDRYDVWAVDPRTGQAYDLTRGLGRKRRLRFTLQQLDRDATSYAANAPLLALAVDDVTKDRSLWLVEPAPSVSPARAMRELTAVPRALAPLAKARDADRIVVRERSFAEPNDLYTARLSEGAFARISDSNPQAAQFYAGTERLIAYRSTWGLPLRGILYEPEAAAARPRGRRPMLVYFYERFSDDFHEMPFTTPAPGTSPSLMRYVSNGYVVFVPDVAYRTGHPGESALDCVLPGIDAAISAGGVDPARVGVAGHSWAAYQIAYMLTRTHRFRAAEAGAAVADMTAAYGGIRGESGVVREFQYEVGQSRIGATPWDRPDLYRTNSALFGIRSIDTPYLTIANDADGAVPPQQGIEFFTAMRRLGKEAYLFSFDGEDHNLVDREAQKYWTVHLDEFFDHFLKGAPLPDWMSHGVDFLHRGVRDVRTLYGEADR